jgi:hypothetical protein
MYRIRLLRLVRLTLMGRTHRRLVGFSLKSFQLNTVDEVIESILSLRYDWGFSGGN